jgi:hypothetical protein
MTDASSSSSTNRVSDPEFPIDQCDVGDKASLTRYRDKRRVWERWLHRDPNHAIWPQIASMLLHDLTFRTLAAAADADADSALHVPIIRSGVVLGYAASQGLAIRRLVDMTGGVISLRRLNMELRNNRDPSDQRDFRLRGWRAVRSRRRIQALICRCIGDRRGHFLGSGGRTECVYSIDGIE